MDDGHPTGTPETRAPTPVRTLGLLVVFALLLMVVLLALGVVDFEQRGWFS
jgi:hypothetical protein